MKEEFTADDKRTNTLYSFSYPYLLISLQRRPTILSKLEQYEKLKNKQKNKTGHSN